MGERSPLIELTDSSGRKVRAMPLSTRVGFDVEGLTPFGQLTGDDRAYEENWYLETNQPLPPKTFWRRVAMIQLRELIRAVDAKVAVGLEHRGGGQRPYLTVAQVSRILVAWDAHHEGARATP